MIRKLYVTCVHPMVEYASVVWADTSDINCACLEHINRRAVRIIAGITRRNALPSDLVLARAGLEPLVKRRQLALCLFAHKASSRLHLLPQHIPTKLSHWLLEPAA